MTNRRFGVEIECDMDGLGVTQTADLLVRHGFQLKHKNVPGWSVGQDGSEVEVRTPPLSGPEGLDQLRQVMELLVDNGGDTTGEDGLHVHHDAPEFVDDFGAIIRLAKSWRANQDLICQMVHPERVNSDNEFCPLWTDDDIEELEHSSYVGNWVRHALNIASLVEHGTIEIRLHEGTLNYEDAEAWILFGQQFIEDVVSKHEPTPGQGSTDRLFEHIRLGHKSGAYLIEKARRNGFHAGDHNQGVLWVP